MSWATAALRPHLDTTRPPPWVVETVAALIGPVQRPVPVHLRPGSSVWRLVGTCGTVALKVSPTGADRGIPREGDVVAELDAAKLLPRPLPAARGQGDDVAWVATWWQWAPHLRAAWTSLPASGSWPPGTARAVLADAAACARTLADLHRAGVRHGDLRPEHLLCERGRGAAMIVDWASGTLTRPMSSIFAPSVPPPAYTGGCPWYAAPEVARAVVDGRQPEPSEAADVWALAESMRVALGGRALRIGQDEPVWTAVAAGVARPFAAGTARRLPELAGLLARALDPDPRARPAADEIASLLRDAVAHRARVDTRAWTIEGLLPADSLATASRLGARHRHPVPRTRAGRTPW